MFYVEQIVYLVRKSACHRISADRLIYLFFFACFRLVLNNFGFCLCFSCSYLFFTCLLNLGNIR